MIKALIKLANQLDSKGMNKEADYIDRMIFSYAQMKSDEKPEDFFMLDDDLMMKNQKNLVHSKLILDQTP